MLASFPRQLSRILYQRHKQKLTDAHRVVINANLVLGKRGESPPLPRNCKRRELSKE
jgi:hypothetical protein